MKIDFEYDDMLVDSSTSSGPPLKPTYLGQAQGLMTARRLRQLAGSCGNFCNVFIKKGKYGCCTSCKKKINTWLNKTRQNGLNLRGQTGVKVLVDSLNIFRTILRIKENPKDQLTLDQWADLFTTVRDELKMIFPSENAKIFWFFRSGFGGWFTDAVREVAQPILTSQDQIDQILVQENRGQRLDCDDITMLKTAGLLGLDKVVMVTNDMFTEYVYPEVLGNMTSVTVNQVQNACVNGAFLGSASDVFDYMLTDCPLVST